MPKFHIFQQFTPIEIERDVDYAANLLKVGEVEAPDGATAIKAAKAWTRFSGRSRSSLLAWPIVEEMDR